MITTIFISSYLLLDPAHWLFKLMELTPMSWDFKLVILALAAGGFAVMYGSETWLFPQLAKWIGEMKVKIRPKSMKKRKEYKIIAEGMRF